MDSLFVISAVGKDQPGLVHSVANVLAKLRINIVDVDARSVRGHFTMFLVVDLSTSNSSYEEMLSRLNPIRSNFDLGLRVEPYKAGRRKADKHIMLLTVMGIDRPGIVAELSGLFVKNSLNIESIKMIARGEYIAMEVSVDISELNDVSYFKNILYDFSHSTKLDVSLRDDDIFQKPKRVVVFDCDSTLIQAEVIDELAKYAGVSDRVKEMTVKAMNGEVDFDLAIKQRVSLLKGLTVEQLKLLSENIKLTPGTEELISALHFMGYKVALISGGFSFFTNYLKERLNLDYVFANELAIENGVTTGKLKGDIIDAKRKGEIIKEVADSENISPDQIVAVGDGANDRFMLENAGLAIAFNPKEVLKKYSDGMITSENILGLLYFLGVPDTELKKIRKQNAI
ncbi:MAG: phosphoserine phosphatase SerB [Desulfobacterales bacterium]|jgi:phosphoserine phosphatase